MRMPIELMAFGALRSPGAPVTPLTPEQRAALADLRSKVADGRYREEPAACLCGADDGWMLACRDRYGLTVHTYLCPHCAVLRSSPRLDAPSLTAFYADDYRRIYGAEEVLDTFFAAQVAQGERIVREVGPYLGRPPGRIFDVGCGAGGALLPFQRAGWQTAGCDIGEQYLDYGRGAGLDLREGDEAVLHTLAPARLIILSHVLEHLADPFGVLQRLRALLAPDGLLLIELPGVLAIHRTYGAPIRFLQNAHLYHFSLTTLTTLLAGAGFRLVRGDERISALFQVDPTARAVTPPGHARLLLRYLALLELGERSRIGPAVHTLRRLMRRLLRPGAS